MAKAAKHEKETRHAGALAPIRAGIPALSHGLVERLDDLLAERWRPFWPMLRWPEEMVRAPAVDVYEEGNEVVVKAELPGMKKEEVEVHVAGDLVTISGKKEKEEKVERAGYYRFERSAGAFSRSVQLPAEVQLDKVTAKLEAGVLEVRAPKAEPGKQTGKKIEVA